MAAVAGVSTRHDDDTVVRYRGPNADCPGLGGQAAVVAQQLWLDEMLANNTVSGELAVLGPQLMSTFWPD